MIKHLSPSSIKCAALFCALWLVGCPPPPEPEDCTTIGDEDGNNLSNCEDPACANLDSCDLCGNSNINAPEQCDGNNLAGNNCTDLGFDGGALACNDACTFDTQACRAAICGDDLLEGDEACDDGNTIGGDGCSADCSKDEVCGDGVIDTGEECDDLNPTDGDGCDNDCQIEPGFTCTGEPTQCTAVAFAIDDAATTTEDFAVSIPVAVLLSNDLNPDNNPLSLLNVSNPINGLVEISNTDVIFTPAANLSGEGIFEYTLFDGAATSTGQVVVTITASADEPVIVANNATGDEDTDITLDIVPFLTDLDGSETLSAISIGGLPIGASVNGLVLTPPVHFNGSLTLTASVTSTEASNGDSEASIVDFTVTINSVNDAPVAIDDTASTNEDTALNIVTSALLANDADPDGEALAVASVQSAVNGSVSFSGNTITFTPTFNFFGQASFEYTITDGSGGFDSALVFIDVAPGNDAPSAGDDIISTEEDTPIDIAQADLLSNDSDPDGDTLLIVSTENEQNGTISIQGNTITFTPNANFNGAASFEYTITDGDLFDTALVIVAVGVGGDSPIAVDDTFSASEDIPLLVNTEELIINDSDADGDLLVVTSVQNAVNGSVSLNGDLVTFTPNANFNGPASFAYTITDGFFFVTGLVSVTVAPVNDAPSATNANISTNEDQSVVITLVGADIDGNALAFTSQLSPVHGSLSAITSLSATTAQVTYTPNLNFHGTDAFGFVTSDGSLSSSLAVVSITINAVNDAPSATDDAFTTNEDTLITINTAQLVSNDSDVDFDILSVSSVTAAINGAVSLVGNTITFTPTANVSGAASFEYTISDGQGGEDIGLVTITVNSVNDAPSFDPIANQTVNEDADATNISITNISAGPANEASQIVTLTAVSNNAALIPNPTISGSGATQTLSFTPALNQSGTATITVTATDNGGTANGGINSAQRTFSITVDPVNDDPVAVDDLNVASTNEDTAVNIATSIILANDSDPDGGTLSVASVQNAVNGAVSLAGNTITFTPDPNVNGPASFDYTITDGQGGFDTANATLTINPVNDAPSFDAIANQTEDEDSGAHDVAITGILGGPTADELVQSVTLSATSSNASIIPDPSVSAVTAGSATLSFTPANNATGTVTITVTATDNGGTANGGINSAQRTFTITVNNVNEAPVAVNDFFTSPASGTTIDAAAGVLINDTDLEGNTFVVSEVEGSASNVGVPTVTDNGVVTLNADGSFTYNPDAGATGDSFSYRVSDGATSNLASVSILVASGVSEIAAGTNHTCALKTDGTVFCWGLNSSGQLGDNTTTNKAAPVQVRGVNNVGNLLGITQISAGNIHTCAVNETSGASFCWGSNGQGRLGDGTTINRSTPVAVSIITGITQISAGNAHTCAVNATSGASFCWGSNSSGQLGNGTTFNSNTPVAVSTITGITQIDAGGAHTCAVNATSGASFCWGSNNSGQVGDGTTINRNTPVAVSTITGISQIAAGLNHTCAANNLGASFCWGNNNFGQLGDGTTTQRNTPVAVSTITGITQISAGGAHTCAVNETSGASFCWGFNANGRLGDGTNEGRNTPVAVSIITGITQISAGNAHTCAVNATSGASFCWGSNNQGQLGDGTLGNQKNTPVAPKNADATPFALSLSEIAAGSFHTCALKTDGTVFCWGFNGAGQLGDGTNTDRSTPVAVSTITGITQISAGSEHACAVNETSGASFCWGFNGDGQLGDGTNEDRNTPVAVSNITGISQITAGLNHTCAANNLGASFCWGSNIAGQLGDGTNIDSNTPVAVSTITGITQISAGGAHTCAVNETSGASFCWGFNGQGQLGDGTTTQRNTPVAVSTITGITQISAGTSHTCAVNATSGASFCWGSNGSGQLGDGTNTDSNTPVAVSTITGITQISAGSDHACAVNETSGASFCWGSNIAGQLGDGTTINRNTPAAVSTITGITQIDAGSEHSCAVNATSGASFCWGSNGSGQLGDGFFAQEVIFP